MSELYVPKEGERFRVVANHPNTEWSGLKLGQELVQGKGCFAYACAQQEWLCVKIKGEVSFCRAEPVEPVVREDKYVVHVVSAAKLGPYLNGEEVQRTKEDSVRRPLDAKVVNIFQESHPDPFAAGAFYNYRVIWERT